MLQDELCKEHMGKYPVIFLSLKQVQGFDYRDAEEQMGIVISLEAIGYLDESEVLIWTAVWRIY